MSYSVDDLSPKNVWRYFDKIRQIPRSSGNEERIAAALIEWAAAAGCSGKKDAAGNVVISVPPSPGAKGAPTLVLQTHMDMVCEKDKDREFDFDKDPIILKRDGDWISADRTTLGADNGIGLAAALALMDEPDLVHGPLEILSTVEEETGLTGASALDGSVVNGRMLFNLDSEEDGIFCVGCAGGLDSLTTLVTERELSKKSMIPYELRVAGLRGGHSGVDIHLNRGNALMLAARVLRALLKETDISLAWFLGGDKHNAIPREAFALILVPPSNEARKVEILAEKEAEFKDELGPVESNLKVTAAAAEFPASVFSQKTAETVVATTLAFPNGILAMMREMAGVVETSNNLARIRCDEHQVTFLNSSRSSVHAAILGTAAKIESVAALSGARYEALGGYPGWKPNMQSSLLDRATKVWRKVHGDEPKIEVIHAGLECGIIGEKLPGMDMISLGPTIENPHSPTERVSISSVERFYDFVKAFVAELGRG